MPGFVSSFVILAGLALGASQPIDCKLSAGLGKEFVPNRVIVRPRGAVSPTVLRGMLSELFKTDDLLIQGIGSTGAFVVDSPSTDLSVAEIPVHGDDRIDYIQLDPYIVAYGSRDPNDPHFGAARDDLWGLVDMAAPAAWLHATGDERIVAAIVDSGIDSSHVDLKKLWSASVAVGGCAAGADGYDAIDDRCVAKARGDHATRMAGAAGARGNNGVGVVGVNWNVGLLSSGFMQDGKGCASVAANALKFVRLVKKTGAGDVRVVNMSWGSAYDSWLIRDELQLLSDEGVVLVAAAGNALPTKLPLNIDNNPVYPARNQFETLIAVAYTARSEKIGVSSNYGPTNVHVAAPGEDIWTTSTEGYGYKLDWGTSIAAAYVSGAVALLASRCPKLSGKELKALVLEFADRRKGLDTFVQDGRFLNVGRAMTECVCKAK